MKVKYLLQILVLILVPILLFAGCNTADTSSETSTPPTSKPTESQTESTPTTESQPENNEVSEPEETIEPIEAIIGKWTTVRDVAPSFRKEGMKIKGKLNVTHYLQFTKKGKYALYPSPDEMNNAVAAVTKKTLLDELTALELTEQDFINAYGMDLDKYVKQYLDSFVISYRTDGEYTLDGNKIIVKVKEYHTVIDTESLTFEFIDGDTLKIKDNDGTYTYKKLKI